PGRLRVVALAGREQGHGPAATGRDPDLALVGEHEGGPVRGQPRVDRPDRRRQLPRRRLLPARLAPRADEHECEDPTRPEYRDGAPHGIAPKGWRTSLTPPESGVRKARPSTPVQASATLWP